MAPLQVQARAGRVRLVSLLAVLGAARAISVLLDHTQTLVKQVHVQPALQGTIVKGAQAKSGVLCTARHQFQHITSLDASAMQATVV